MCRYSDPAISWNLQGQNFISRTCNPTLFRKHIWCIGECKSRARGRCWNSISVHYICMKPPLKLISFPESFFAWYMLLCNKIALVMHFLLPFPSYDSHDRILRHKWNDLAWPEWWFMRTSNSLKDILSIWNNWLHIYLFMSYNSVFDMSVLDIRNI